MGEAGAEPVALRRSNHELVVDVAGRGRLLRINRGDFAAPRVGLIKIAQFDSQNCGLQLVEPAVHARDFADVAILPSVLAEGSRPGGDFRAAGNDGSSVADRAEIR